MNFFRDGLSIDETRISSLMLAFFVTLGIGIKQLILTGDISSNLVTLLGYEIMGITGINVATRVGKPSNNNYTNVKG